MAFNCLLIDCCRSDRDPSICPPQESAFAMKVALRMVTARQRKGEKIPWQG
jgi:hypothetical protein